LNINSKIITAGFKIKNILFKYIHINKYILYLLKHKRIEGYKMMASGRLTRRYTAAKSVNYYELIGGNRNIESKYLKIKNKLIRNRVNSNIKCTKLATSNRIGTYGLQT
jgi:hypothetical protein